MSAAVLKAVRTQQQVLEKAALRWLADVQGDAESRGPLVLPVRDVTGTLLDLGSLIDAFPDVLSRAEGKEAKVAVRNRLRAITGELSAANGPLRDSFSTLALEAATGRTLIVRGDLFDVSAFGLAVMAALSNLLHLFGRKPRLKREVPVEPDPSSIEDLLEFASAKGAERPGDLWLAEVAARTALAVWDEAGNGNRKQPAWLQKVMPRFVAISLLFKLTALNKFGAALAKRADYKLWPGLDVLLVEPGSRPLRAVLVGELANALCGTAGGLTQIALFRFLSALSAIEDPAKLLAARDLSATLCWEILELDSKALARMVDLGQAASSLLDMIESTDAAGRGPAPEGLEAEHARLAESCACLRTFPEFIGLLALRRGLVANRSIL